MNPTSLGRIKHQDWIEARVEPGTGNPVRKVYTLTERGGGALMVRWARNAAIWLFLNRSLTRDDCNHCSTRYTARLFGTRHRNCTGTIWHAAGR